MTKPRVTQAGIAAYAKVAALAIDTPVTIDGVPAVFVGMTGYLVTLKMKGRVRYLRAGDPLIERIEVRDATPHEGSKA